ncbi:MAG: rhodanese-like domain-containing protein [Bacteroidetes bacterium]|nr:MAG: rhodanese-like domain-containing protein [Bacteroidota bacterium]
MPDRPLSNIRRLTIAVAAFTAFIVIGLLTIGKPKFKYKVSSEDMLSQIMKADYLVSPEAAKELMAGDNTQVKFVDLRNKYDFNIGHLEGALNIPNHTLLEKDNLNLFEDTSITYVLYGQEHLDANGPWMVLRQLGYSNFKVLQGGYAAQMADSLRITGDAAIYDYTSILKEAEKEIYDLQKVTEAPPPPKPVKKKVVKVVPKKVVEEVEEEEGC